jgi:16S rRNA (guanine(966)-N(2))-methyltransferase RsmD
MRIISGTLKGRSIDVPRNFKGRPTTDFAREGLFNVLNNKVQWDGIKVLDLFAGTGAFSLECFSRGVSEIVAVDIQPLHVRFINDNFQRFGADDAHAFKADVFKWIPSANQQFDLIFADPPYDIPGLIKLPAIIMSTRLLKPNGLLVIEHGKRTNLSDQLGFQMEKSYSNVSFSFFGI